IDTGDAEQVARGLLVDERTKLEWHAARVLMPKNKVKLALNLCLIAAAAIPRGGMIRITVTGEGTAMIVEASGANARVAGHVPALLAGKPETGSVDAHGIQAYYTGLVAHACGMKLALTSSSEGMRITAEPIHAEALPEPTLA
ncbi:MAG TPA: histidine phosphotransferase family protein, partial [Beijerinckiaceae bacterium]|nr:histidine phosphotransferase family protein [Beijerinckiaceae bacterium]